MSSKSIDQLANVSHVIDVVFQQISMQISRGESIVRRLENIITPTLLLLDSLSLGMREGEEGVFLSSL